MTSNLSYSISDGDTEIGTMTATDDDGDLLEYSLSGTDAESFNIDIYDGTLTLKDAASYSAKNSYSLNIVYQTLKIKALNRLVLM